MSKPVNMTVIAPIITPQMKQRIRIAAYCRVSTDAGDQKHSFQVQKAHFMSLYGRSADYELCADGCIPHEKMMTEEHEIDTELQHISDQIARLQNLADDSAEQIESLYNAVSFMQPEMLAERFLDHAVTDGNTITFYLSGGLHFTERLV